MNARFLILGLAVTTTLCAADASKILLKGNSIIMEEGRASGAASAVVGDMNISAEVITFDKEKSSLKCDGSVTIRVSGNVVTTKDCVIELSPGQKKLFFLSRGEIQVSPKEVSYFPVSSPDLIGRRSDREKLILEFNSRMQPEKAPNKAPEPTPGAVTPPATSPTPR